jgi:hypothetical protein
MPAASPKHNRVSSPLFCVAVVVPRQEIDLTGRSFGVAYAGSVFRPRARFSSEMYVHRLWVRITNIRGGVVFSICTVATLMKWRVELEISICV